MSEPTLVCVLCGGSGLERLFDLGVLPLGAPVAADADPLLWRRPLAMAICRRCSMVQTEYQLPADLLMTETVYTSNRSASIADHDRAFAVDLLRRGLAAADSLVLEVGCSDGALLDRLREHGFNRLLGIDPSPHADHTYHAEVITGLFDDAMVQRLRDEGRKPDLVIANHVLDGVPHPGAFIVNLARLLEPGASLVIEAPDFVDFVRALRLDGFTHSRNSWFTAAALVYALKAAGLSVDDIQHDEAYRGGTLRAFARRAPQAALPPAVTTLLEREAAALSAASFASFRVAVARLRAEIVAGVRALTGMPLYVYGGGLKASTILNWLGVTRRDVVCAVDNDPHKHGKLIPGVDIPIEPVDRLWRQTAPIAVLNLALDHHTEVESELVARLPAGSTIVDALPEWRESRVAARAKGERMSEFEMRNREKIADISADTRLYALTREWFERSSRHEYPYHFTWMGLPIIQFPQDIVAMQEIIWRVKPDLIVETGVARGGSVVFYASLLELAGGEGRVIGIDVDIRAPNRAAIEASSVSKRITLIEGSSVDASVVARVRAAAAAATRVLVSLDSNHTHAHVLEELRAYAPCVTRDSYLVVFDTSIEHLPPDVLGDRPWAVGNSPATAVREFLATTDQFVVDTDMDHKLLITEAPGGYLKCVKV